MYGWGLFHLELPQAQLNDRTSEKKCEKEKKCFGDTSPHPAKKWEEFYVLFFIFLLHSAVLSGLVCRTGFWFQLPEGKLYHAENETGKFNASPLGKEEPLLSSPFSLPFCLQKIFLSKKNSYAKK